MIAFLTGRVAGKAAGSAIIEVGGVGYRLMMSTPSLAALPAVGDEVTVHTHLHVREDELTLFGFENEEERELFGSLTAISGIGPKLGLSVLSSLRPDALRGAVAHDDVALLSSVPGVGKKTAQRMLIELKDRLGMPGSFANADGARAQASVADARDALLGMGFTTAEAAMALREAPVGASTEQLLKAALKALGGRA